MNNDSDNNDLQDGLLKFKQLFKSLLDDGYKSDEIILIRKNKFGKNVVLEGNRRVAAIKILNYLKNSNNNEWIAWFIKNFTKNYFNEIKVKIMNWRNDPLPCKDLTNFSYIEIKRMVYRSDQVNKFGKKYWPRLVRLDFVYDEWKELLKDNDKKESIYQLAKLFDKDQTGITKDLKGAQWIKFCLNMSKQYNNNEYNKWSIKKWKIMIKRNQSIN